MAVSDALDGLVRKVDEDRWLASRFAPMEARQRLIALYALNHEIARAPQGARDFTLGAMRLTWWRDALEEIHAGKPPRAHPALQAYAPIAAHVSQGHWTEIIEARSADAERAQFASWDSVAAYIERTAQALISLACEALAIEPTKHAALIQDSALAWGFTGLARAAPYWAARGRALLPGAVSEAASRGLEAYARVRQHKLSSSVFPALGYVALTPLYLRALATENTEMPLLARQFTLLRASLTGRL